MITFNKKVYWTLLPFAAVIAIGFIFFAPYNGMTYAFITVIVFWIVYYVWDYAERKRKKRKQ